ncbi:serine dehydratase beta chain [Shigella flexneri]
MLMILSRPGLLETTRIQVDVYGSRLDRERSRNRYRVSIMGLAGNLPDSVDIYAIPGFIRDVEERERLLLANDNAMKRISRHNGSTSIKKTCRCMKTACQSAHSAVMNYCR